MALQRTGKLLTRGSQEDLGNCCLRPKVTPMTKTIPHSFLDYIIKTISPLTNHLLQSRNMMTEIM